MWGRGEGRGNHDFLILKEGSLFGQFSEGVFMFL